MGSPYWSMGKVQTPFGPINQPRNKMADLIMKKSKIIALRDKSTAIRMQLFIEFVVGLK